MGDRPPFSTIARAMKFQITKNARAFSSFGQIKRIAHVKFSYFRLNTNSPSRGLIFHALGKLS